MIGWGQVTYLGLFSVSLLLGHSSYLRDPKLLTQLLGLVISLSLAIYTLYKLNT